jgi:anti-sigma regulatory factor (Ser/Thr protein kinase)
VIKMTVDSERVNVQVRDSGRWQNPPQGRAEYPATGTTVMRSLSDRFEIEKGSDGTIVSFSLPIRERVR